MFHKWMLVACCLVFTGCRSEAPGEAVIAPLQATTSGEENANFGAVSVDVPAQMPSRTNIASSTDWPSASVTSGQASVSCSVDYDAMGDGTPLVNLEFFSVLDAMSACQKTGVVRLHYRGKIVYDFTLLVERVVAMAERMEIDNRILDIDSSGGHVEQAIRAGDMIAESGWTVWVREEAVCHSACVLVIAAGDNRMISGKVGVHRIIRLESKATSRKELNLELEEVSAKIGQYLARNGVALTVADLMMTVPNRSLRLLSADELKLYGVDGINAAQDDLDRIVLARRCGDDFVQRRDRFFREFDRKCAASEDDVEAKNTCGLGLRERFGFPDQKCRADSPLSEYDIAQDRRVDNMPGKTPVATGGVSRKVPSS